MILVLIAFVAVGLGLVWLWLEAATALRIAQPSSETAGGESWQ